MNDNITLPYSVAMQALLALWGADQIDKDAIAALTAALAQQAEPDRWVIEKVGDKLMLNGKEIDPGTIELRLDGLTYRSSEKMEVRQQAEPVACKPLCELCVKRGYEMATQPFCLKAAKTTPIAICPTPPQQQAEPVQEPFEDLATELFVVAQRSPADEGFSDTIDRIESWLREHFSTQPQHKPLTDEQVKELFMKDLGTDYLDDFVCGIRAAEAVHGIK